MALFTAVSFGSEDIWDAQNWTAVEQEAQAIMEQVPYTFPYHYNTIFAHSHHHFSGLNSIEVGDLVIYNRSRFRVKYFRFVKEWETDILKQNPDGVTLITCTNNPHVRLAVIAK